MDFIFPNVKLFEQSAYEKNYYDRIFVNERMLYIYLRKKMDGWSVCDYLHNKGMTNFALYAMTNLSELMIRDIRNTDTSCMPIMISDRDAGKIKGDYLDCKVVVPAYLQKAYHVGKIEKIIITSVLHENEIYLDLMNSGINQRDIISFVTVLTN